MRCYKETFKIAPISAFFSQLYQWIEQLFPAIIIMVLTRFFDAVETFTIVGESDRITVHAILLLGCYGIKQLLLLVSSVTLNAGVYEKCTHYYKIKLAEKAARLPLIYYEDSEKMNIKKRAEDCVQGEKISQLYMSMGKVITIGFGIISVFVVLSHYSLWLVPISILSVIPYLISRIIRGKEFYRLKYHQAKKMRKLDYLWGLLVNRQSLKEMRVMESDEYLSKQWMNCRDEVNNELWNHYKKDAFIVLCCDILRVLGYGMSIFFTLYLTIQGDISIGLFGACLSAFTAFQSQIQSFLSEIGALPEKVAFVSDYYEFIELLEEEKRVIHSVEFKESISISNVSFQYPNTSAKALDNVNVKINKGEQVAIIGENGSGKTTLAKLILGIYEPNEGDIYFDKLNLSNIKEESLYPLVSGVTQDFVAYELTLRENIAISNLNFLQDEKRIKKTLVQVGLSDLLNEMNLDDQLGKKFNGKELSGGQWQKIAIARALFKESEIIVLDEPTSALDPLVESEILTNFSRLMKGKTAIIISHRVGLCKMVDKIIVMKDRKIVEIGNHEELLSKKEEYYRLYQSQEKWYRDAE